MILAALNLIAIVANAGVMPASATAERIAGETQGAGYHNATALAHRTSCGSVT